MDIVLNQNISIQNPELKKVTTEIRKASANVIGNTFKIASLIAYVEKNELYIEDEFADVFEYAKACFGLEKASVYNLIRIGNDFITEVKNGNVKSFETLLTHASDKDYSISQVVKMLPLGIEKAKELTADGVIDETMSCRQIERIVKENTDGTKARGKSKSEPEETESGEPEESEDDTTIIVTWEDLPEEFCDWFRKTYDFENFDSIGEIIIR